MSEKLICSFCKEISATLRCSGCKSAAYCSVDHQKKHWKEHKSACRPFKECYSPEFGRYLIATRDIAANDFIFTENPIAIGPKWVHEEKIANAPLVTCVGCFSLIPLHTASRCKTCHWPACKPDCPGLENDKLHKLECGVLAFGRHPKNDDLEAAMDFFRSDALLALKCLMLQSQAPRKWGKLMEFESHARERKGTELYQEADSRIVSYLKRNFLDPLKIFELKSGKKLLPECDSDVLHKICGIIDTNALLVPLPTGQDVAAIYPTYALMEHSCLPNCGFTIKMNDGFKIVVKAAQDIKKGEHLHCCYISTLWGTLNRREFLMKTKHFGCKCARCRDPTEFGTYFSALRCMGIDAYCGGHQLPEDPLNLNSDWICDRCPIRLSAEQVTFLTNKMGEEVDALVYNKDVRVQDVQTLIDKLIKFLHKDHYHLFVLKHQLIQLLGNKEGLEHYRLKDHSLEDKIKICKELLSVVEKFDPQGLRVAIYLGVIFCEMAQAEIELTQRRIQAAQEPEEKINEAKVLDLAEEHVRRGIEVLQNDADTVEAQKLIAKLELLNENLQKILSKSII